MSPILSEIGIRGYRVKACEDKPSVRVVVEPLKERPCACPRCGGRHLHSKGRYRRKVRHLESFGAFSTLIVECRRFRCCACHRSFVQPLPGILPGRHTSEPFRQRLWREHHDGICASRLARLAKLGQATIERIYHQFTEVKARERKSLLCPQVLGIDEHTLHKGCRFATTFCDLRNHSVFDIVQGKSAASLEAFLLRLQGREHVRVVCIDLSSSYRALIRRYFPRARIVADRFHVVRLVTHHFMELFRAIGPDLKYSRPYLAALRTRPDRLTDRRRDDLAELFRRYPAFKPLYSQMRKLIDLLCRKHRTHRQCRHLAPQLLTLTRQLAESGFAPLATLATTLESWQEEIACMWRFTKNNGITEGFHRKMKLIQRRAYGFRNFENYRLRVLAQCG